MMMKYKNLKKLLANYKLILASGSPRRIRLLNEANISYRQIIPDINEDNSKQLKPNELATFLAREKSNAVFEQAKDNEIILGCDTIVILGEHILGKPSSKKEAVRMLKRLSGNRHTVCSAIALLAASGEMVSDFELTDVYFRAVSSDEIEDYVNTGEPMDKAGAYGMQGRGIFLVDRFAGNIDNVIGLPMALLDELAGRLSEQMRLYAG